MSLNPRVTDQGTKVRVDWTPDLTCQGYRLYVDGVAVARTFKPAASSTVFTKPDGNPHRYGVQMMDVVGSREDAVFPVPSFTPFPADGVIRTPGMYGGPFAKQIKVTTTGPVIFDQLDDTYKDGTMIATGSLEVDLTIRHSRFEGDVWRIIDADAFRRLDLQHLSIEKTSGVTVVGDGDITYMYSRHHNIQRVPGGVGNFLQRRVAQAGIVMIGWNEVVNQYNLSDPEDLISFYHASGGHVFDSMFWGQFNPGNGPNAANGEPCSQNGITIDGYGGSATNPTPVNDSVIERVQMVRTLSIAIFPTAGGPIKGTRFLENRVVNSGLLDDGVTRNRFGYQGMSVKPGGSDNQAHENVLGTMKGTSQGTGRGQDGDFSGEPRTNGNGTSTGAWTDNFHLDPGQPITPAHEQAEWDRWVQKKAAAGVSVGA